MKREVTNAEITYRFKHKYEDPPTLHFSLSEYKSGKKYKYPEHYTGWSLIVYRGFPPVGEYGRRLKAEEVGKVFSKYKLNEVRMETTVWRHNRSYSLK